MDSDLALVIGLVLAALTVFAIQDKPGGYRLEQLPDVFISVIARYIS